MHQSRTCVSLTTAEEHALRRAAALDTAVLVTCPDEAERANCARVIHAASARSSGPFVVLDCDAVYRETVADADEPSPGDAPDLGAPLERAFELAQGGSLFIDDVERIPSAVQLRLMSLLDARSPARQGMSDRGSGGGVRIISGAATALWPAIAAGTFNAALFYRLNVIHLDLTGDAHGNHA